MAPVAEVGQDVSKPKPVRRFAGQALLSILLIAVVASLFFALHVAPQSKYERERIYRSMDQVSRLIDDRIAATHQALELWQPMDGRAAVERVQETRSPPLGGTQGPDGSNTASGGTTSTESESVQNEISIPGFAFGCSRADIICLKKQDPKIEASISIQSIIEDVDLPYDDAILLIMDSNGRVLYGYDSNNKWQQFESLSSLVASPTPNSQNGNSSAGSTTDEVFRVLQRYGRGEENPLYDGYPARLTRDVGGQSFSIFITSQQLGRSLPSGVTDELRAVVKAGGEDDTAAIENVDHAEANRQDQLLFAYLVPVRSIDSAALRLPSDWMINLMFVLLAVLLSIPFLKLLNRGGLKSIMTKDLAAILISAMMILATITIMSTAILLRSSIASDIERELRTLALRSSQMISDELRHESTILGEQSDNLFVLQQNQGGYGDQGGNNAVEKRSESKIGADKNVSFYISEGDNGKCCNLHLWQPDKKSSTVRWRAKPKAIEQDVAISALGLESLFLIGPAGNCAEPAPDFCGNGIWQTSIPKPSNLSVADRAYFQAFQRQYRVDGMRYVQILRAKSTGRLNWSMVLELAPDAPWATRKSGGAVEASGATSPFVLTAMPIALRAPILPRNFRFLIVLNRDLPPFLQRPGSAKLGDVQYSSEQSYSLIENLIHEARDNPQLAAAIRVLRQPSRPEAGDQTPGIDSGLIPITYHGRSQFVVIRPVAGTPWSVVAMFDRSEPLSLFSQTIAQALFLCCFWILMVVFVCWLVPRLLRLIIKPAHTVANDADPFLPIRGRSLWFFPNGLNRSTDTGVSYSFEKRGDETALLAATIVAQLTSLVLLLPDAAALTIAALGVLALVSDYLLIARPITEDADYPKRRGIMFVAATALGAILLFGITLGWQGPAVFLATAIFITVAFAFGRSRYEKPDSRLAVRPELVRRQYLIRAVTLLAILVALPTTGLFNFAYIENLKGYVAASTISAAETVAEQRRVLREELGQHVLRNEPGELGGFDPLSMTAFGMEKFTPAYPGWFISGSEEKDPDGNRLSGTFSLDKGETCELAPQAGRSAVGKKPDENGNRAGQGLLPYVAEQFTPHFATRVSVIRDSANQVEIRPNDGILTFCLPLARADLEDANETFLRGGPVKPFPIHPAPLTAISVLVGLTIFAYCYYLLLRESARRLTGLYLEPEEPDAARITEFEKLVGNGYQAAWDALKTPAEKSMLLALAFSRTINFEERGTINQLIRNGYLKISPYVRISDVGLADWIRHDLPTVEREQILAKVSTGRDNWDRLRLPLFIAFGSVFVLLIYSSPGAVQLVLSAFVAVTALLPMLRDPVTRFIDTANNVSGD